MQQDETTVILAEDHVSVREGYASLCHEYGLRILGQCSDGPTALTMVRELRPDFAILDLRLPGMTGVEVIRKLHETGSSSKLMILTLHGERKTVLEAVDAGADAYILKGGPFRHVLEAISYVREGGVYISPDLGGARALTNTDRDPLALLTSRERQVLPYLIRDRRVKDIAGWLGISIKTVDTHRANIMRKLDVDGIADLVRFAIEHGLFDDDSFDN